MTARRSTSGCPSSRSGGGWCAVSAATTAWTRWSAWQRLPESRRDDRRTGTGTDRLLVAELVGLLNDAEHDNGPSATPGSRGSPRSTTGSCKAHRPDPARHTGGHIVSTWEERLAGASICEPRRPFDVAGRPAPPGPGRRIPSAARSRAARRGPGSLPPGGGRRLERHASRRGRAHEETHRQHGRPRPRLHELGRGRPRSRRAVRLRLLPLPRPAPRERTPVVAGRSRRRTRRSRLPPPPPAPDRRGPHAGRTLVAADQHQPRRSPGPRPRRRADRPGRGSGTVRWLLPPHRLPPPRSRSAACRRNSSAWPVSTTTTACSADPTAASPEGSTNSPAPDDKTRSPYCTTPVPKLSLACVRATIAGRPRRLSTGSR